MSNIYLASQRYPNDRVEHHLVNCNDFKKLQSGNLPFFLNIDLQELKLKTYEQFIVEANENMTNYLKDSFKYHEAIKKLDADNKKLDNEIENFKLKKGNFNKLKKYKQLKENDESEESTEEDSPKKKVTRKKK